MKDKTFFIRLLSLFGTLSLLVCGINYWGDIYGVFRGSRQAVIENIYINDRFVKMEYLLTDRNYEKYDAFLWGSSRVQKMDPHILRPNAYNMGVSWGLPQDCLYELSILLKYGCKPQAVYLGLDNFSYESSWAERTTSISRKPYYEEAVKRGMYYMDLVLNPGRAREGLRRQWKQDGEGEGKTFLQRDGMYLVPERVEEAIEKEPDSYVKEEKFLKPSEVEGKSKESFAECIDTIAQIKRICEENGIEFIPFFNPLHMTTYLDNDMDRMNRFKRELVKISPFWDFSGVNVITVNNYFWYETSHPRAFVCDKILDKVSGKNQMTWVPDFGVYVTADNVDAFCEKAVKDRERYDPNHEQWVPTAEERAAMTKRINYPW